jgi:ligand-binding SRPBCC domain-containing protein
LILNPGGARQHKPAQARGEETRADAARRAYASGPERPTLPARHVLERVQLLPVPRAEAFSFFADARNLERITPPWLRFRIVTEGVIPMRPGTLIDYRLSLFGIPFGWRTRIEAFDPGRSFVDQQVEGPYRWWNHLHLFEDAPAPATVSGRAGTLVTDRVEYELPLGPLGAVAHAAFVRGALARIFDHRCARVAALLAAPSVTSGAAR